MSFGVAIRKKYFCGSLFPWSVFQKRLFPWSVHQKTIFSMIRSPKKCFCQETLGKFGKNKNEIPKVDPKIYLKNQGWQKSKEKAIPKHRPAKNPASQKAKQSPTKTQLKFQKNSLKNGASAACGASVVVLKFVSIFCWTWLGFLAELFLAGFLALIFWDRFLDRFFEQIFVFSKPFSKVSWQKPFLEKLIFAREARE